jgi:hypothetical protein
MSWFSEISFEQGETAIVAALVVGAAGSAAAVLVRRGKETPSRMVTAEPGPVAAHLPPDKISFFQRFYYLPEIAIMAATISGCFYLLFYIGK